MQLKRFSAGLAAMLLVWSIVNRVGADELKLTPSVAVREDFNDNLFFDYDDAEEDYLTTFTVGLGLLSRTERRSLKLDAMAAPFFYAENDDLDDTDASVLADIGYLLSPRLKTQASGFVRLDNRPDRDIDVTGLVLGANERTSYHGAATLEYAWHENHSLSGSYTYDQEDWRAEDADLQDFEGHMVGAGYKYDMSRWFTATDLLLSAGYGVYDYEISKLESVFASVGIQRMLNDIFRLNMSAGARYTESEFEVTTAVLVPPGTIVESTETLTSDAWGGIGSIGLDYLGERTRCNLVIDHDLRTGGGIDGASNLSRLMFHIRYLLQEKLAVGLFTGYYVNRTDADEFSRTEQDLNTFNFRPFLRWEFLDNFILEGAYHFTNVADRLVDRTAERNIAYLRLAYGYDLLN